MTIPSPYVLGRLSNVTGFDLVKLVFYTFHHTLLLDFTFYL